MLKITAVDTEHTRTLVLEGQLVDPWISELERSWNQSRMSIRAQSIVVHLRDVTAISERGANVLFAMMSDGAQFNCYRGVLTKHVLKQLKQRCKAQSRKA